MGFSAGFFVNYGCSFTEQWLTIKGDEMNEIRERIHLILRNIIGPAYENEKQGDLFEIYDIDSLSVTQLIVDLENAFGFQMDDDDLINIQTLDSIEAIVNRHQLV